MYLNNGYVLIIMGSLVKIEVDNFPPRAFPSGAAVAKTM